MYYCVYNIRRNKIYDNNIKERFGRAVYNGNIFIIYMKRSNTISK